MLTVEEVEPTTGWVWEMFDMKRVWKIEEAVMEDIWFSIYLHC